MSVFRDTEETDFDFAVVEASSLFLLSFFPRQTQRRCCRRRTRRRSRSCCWPTTTTTPCRRRRSSVRTFGRWGYTHTYLRFTRGPVGPNICVNIYIYTYKPMCIYILSVEAGIAGCDVTRRRRFSSLFS